MVYGRNNSTKKLLLAGLMFVGSFSCAFSMEGGKVDLTFRIIGRTYKKIWDANRARYGDELSKIKSANGISMQELDDRDKKWAKDFDECLACLPKDKRIAFLKQWAWPVFYKTLNPTSDPDMMNMIISKMPMFMQNMSLEEKSQEPLFSKEEVAKIREDMHRLSEGMTERLIKELRSYGTVEGVAKKVRQLKEVSREKDEFLFGENRDDVDTLIHGLERGKTFDFQDVASNFSLQVEVKKMWVTAGIL